ncbi:MAG: HAD family phosphatase [Chloroflexota bacterium]|nr:HAD family phosphatase [Chloroflexota bacterium]MDE2885594.1 HAD family phosphatase [Chloroflexota bacterium]
MNPPRLVIFDCDGVLVDSEPLTSRAMRDVLAHYGLNLDLDEIQARFHGVSNDQVHDTVLAHWGVLLPDDLVDRFEEAERVAVEDGLRAVPGVADAVRAVVGSGMAVCVGSNASPRAIEQRLKLTGLHPWFEGRLFSAALVARGKPHPDVFLHAAETMGFSPSDCVVIEDSDAGVQAALAAGMRVLAYAASPTSDVAHARRVERFADMASLPALLGIDGAQA